MLDSTEVDEGGGPRRVIGVMLGFSSGFMVICIIFKDV